MQQVNSSGKITSVHEKKFKGDVFTFLMAMCKHMMGKTPLSSLIARCLISLSPMYMTESTEACELLFDKMLMKWLSCKNFLTLQLTLEKWQFFTLLKTVAHDKEEEFSSFSREHDMLDLFLWKFMDTKTFDDLQHVIKLVLILAHGQVQVEWGFNGNK